MRAALHPVVTLERGGGFGERREEQRVPPEQHLVVALRPHPELAPFEQRRSSADHGLGRGLVALRHVEDAAAEVRMRVDEVSGRRDTEVANDLLGIVAADVADLGRRPQVELALDALGIGVLRGREATGGIGQVAAARSR